LLLPHQSLTLKKKEKGKEGGDQVWFNPGVRQVKERGEENKLLTIPLASSMGTKWGGGGGGEKKRGGKTITFLPAWERKQR